MVSNSYSPSTFLWDFASLLVLSLAIQADCKQIAHRRVAASSQRQHFVTMRLFSAACFVTALCSAHLEAINASGALTVAAQSQQRRRLEACTSLLTASSASSSISVDDEDFFLVQPSSSETSYPANTRASWSFRTSSTSTYGILIEVLELDSERSFDTLNVLGRISGSSTTSSVDMSGTTPPFSSRVYQSGVSLSWRSDRSNSPGVGFRVRVSRARIPGSFSRASSLSGFILTREYATTVHLSNRDSKSISVPDGREIALQATTTSAYIGGMTVAWTLGTQRPSQTFKVDILDVDMRSTDTVTLSASGWSLVLSGDGVPAESTYYVHGPMTVTVRTSSGNHVGTFDIRVHNTNTQPTVGTGAAAPRNTCGGSGSLPPAASGGGGGIANDDDNGGGSTTGGGSSSSSSPSSSFEIGGIIGSIFPIFIVLGVASVAYRYYKQRKARQRAAATTATSASTVSLSNNNNRNNGNGGASGASSFAMGTASPRTASSTSASLSVSTANPNATMNTQAVAPYPGTTSTGYGAPPTSPGGAGSPGSPPSTGGYPGAPPGGAGYPGAYPPAANAPPTAYPGAAPSSGDDKSPYTSAYPGAGAPPQYSAYPGVSPSMAPSMAPYSSAYPAASAYPGAPPAYGSAPPSSTPGSSAYPGM